MFAINTFKGATAFFTFMHHHPELSDKVELSVLLAPVATVASTKSLIRYLIPFRKSLLVNFRISIFSICYIHHLSILQKIFLLWYLQFLTWLLNIDLHFGSPTMGLYSRFVRKLCLKTTHSAIQCHNALLWVAGAKFENVDPVCIPFFFSEFVIILISGMN